MKRKLNKRSVALLVCLAVILTATVGVTLAYIFTNTDALQNLFTPAHVSCAVVENDETTEHYNGQNPVFSKTNVQIKNTGDTDAYIRVAIVVNWKSADGTTVYAKAPGSGDYKINFATGTGWDEGADGYYYYTSSVASGDLTKTLISSVDVTNKTHTDEAGNVYYLSIEIVASAIQANPTDVVKDQWGVTVANDGTISK